MAVKLCACEGCPVENKIIKNAAYGNPRTGFYHYTCGPRAQPEHSRFKEKKPKKGKQ